MDVCQEILKVQANLKNNLLMIQKHKIIIRIFPRAIGF